MLVDTTGTNGVIYYNERSGLFVTVDEDMYCSSVTVSRMNATVIEQVWSGREEREINSDTVRYYSDNEEIDESDYEAFLNEFMPEGILSNADGYSITEENLNEMLNKSRASSNS